MAQINKPNEYFNTVLYTGNGSTQSVTGVNFQPDWSWLKCRSTAYNHRLYDSVRGALKNLISNSTAAEATADNGLSAFNSDGFTVTEGGDAYNSSGQTYVGWNWLAGGTASSNTDGSITSTVSANTTSGFSIVSFTAPASGNFTVGHGLSSPPEMIIIKNRDISQSWYVLHKDLTSFTDRYLRLQTTSAEITYPMMSQTPSTTLLYLIVGATADASNNHIMYCFNSVKGYSKIGSYTGNRSTDGTFIYTGFKPAFVMVKRSDGGTSGWYTLDSARNTFNVVQNRIEPNTSNTESTGLNIFDFVSNGFKLRDSDTAWNVNGGTYIYIAFAENPLVGTNNIPTTVR